jgi:hypothetical protein
MARVLTHCPTDGRTVPTGHRMTDTQLAATQARYAFRCSACGGIHQWTRIDAWLEASTRV